jgi:hypothetical protein
MCPWWTTQRGRPSPCPWWRPCARRACWPVSWAGRYLAITRRAGRYLETTRRGGRYLATALKKRRQHGPCRQSTLSRRWIVQTSAQESVKRSGRVKSVSVLAFSGLKSRVSRCTMYMLAYIHDKWCPEWQKYCCSVIGFNSAVPDFKKVSNLCLAQPKRGFTVYLNSIHQNAVFFFFCTNVQYLPHTIFFFFFDATRYTRMM